MIALSPDEALLRDYRPRNPFERLTCAACGKPLATPSAVAPRAELVTGKVTIVDLWITCGDACTSALERARSK